MTDGYGQGGSGGRHSPGWPGLTWYEVADALWLAARTADAGESPVQPLATADAAGPPPIRPPTEGAVTEPDPLLEPEVPAQSTPADEPPAAAPAEPAPVAAHSDAGPGPAGPGKTAVATANDRSTRDLWLNHRALPGATAITRALRPLKRFVTSTREQLLDEQATAERAAEDRRWLPVLQPASELYWDVTLVVDDHDSMMLWRDTVTEFVALLRRQGAFRNVAVRLLTTDGKEPAALTLRGPGGGATTSPPTELLTANGRRLVVVMTDGTGPAWSTGSVSPTLRTWARRLPLVVVHLLPSHQWYRTGIRPQRLRLRAPAAGAANARLAWELRDPVPGLLNAWHGLAVEEAVPVPVVQLEARWLAAWVRLITGDGGRWTNLPALLLPPCQGPASEEEWSDEQPATDPRQRVREFASWATPTALALATHLAAAPLNLRVIRLLQRRLVPTSDTSHLSEILTSGLLHPVAPPAEVADPARITFEFDHGVREELLAVGRRADAARVLQVVDDCLGPTIAAVRGLKEVLDDPENAPLPPVTPETAPFVRVEQTVLQAFSGKYLARSRRLRRALVSGEPVGQDHEEPETINVPAAARSTTSLMLEGADVSSSTVQETVAAPEAVAAPQRTPTRAPVVWGNVPGRNPNFTGRDELLQQLHERMRTGTTAVLPQALHGMGGVGKSQLAVEYVYRHQDQYDLVWWIPSERPAQIGAALVELAQRMELQTGREANTAVPAVREALRLGRPYANWLLIFDNAESPESVRSYFPTGGPGSIMVTSRNPQWANIARPLEVDVFTREESMALLRRRGPELDDDAADRLAVALGDLPLALEQAAAWRAETGMPADEYLRLFEEKRTELLEVSAPLDYQLPVAAAWNVSLDRLVVSNPAALRLLQVCAFFAPEPIPRTLLAGARATDIHPELNTALRDPMRLNRAIREINRYALAKIDHRTNSLQMHRLIQAVLIDRMSEAERAAMRHSAHLLLAASDRHDPNSAENWRTYAELYPHVMGSEAYHATDPWVQQLVNNEAVYLYWWGDHEAAYELARRTYDSRRERLGTDAPATLSIGRWLGYMYFVLGRFSQAREFNAEMAEAHERASNGDSEELLSAIGAVAADHRVAGDFKAALEIDEDVYRRHVRALGEEDPATLYAAHNLAVCVRLNGDLKRAFEINRDVHQRRVLMFGEDHPVTLASTRHLIIDRRELGEYASARTAAQDVADRLRERLGTGHPQTLRAMRGLASAIRKAGDHQAARAVSEEVWKGFVTRYGEEHPDTVAAGLNLAIDLRQTGEMDAAAELGEQVYGRYRQLLGAHHPHTIAAGLNFAVTQRLRDNVAHARRLNEEGLRLFREQLGEDHPLTLACAVNFASDLHAQGEFAAAHQHDADTAERLRHVLGEDHPTTLACLGNIAMDLMALGRETEARELHADVVARFQRTLGEDHPATAAAADLTVRANCDLDPMPL